MCFPHAAAGLGDLADHCRRQPSNHGWGKHKDVHGSCNSGRGREYFEYRSFLMRNLGLDPAELVPRRHKILVHTHSSRRSGSFKRQIKALKEAFAARAKEDSSFAVPDIEASALHRYGAAAQARLLATTSVYVVHMGGGSLGGVFLPRGAGPSNFLQNTFSDRTHCNCTATARMFIPGECSDVS